MLDSNCVRSDTYVKKVKIGDAMVNALIDTGSSDCTIGASVVIENNFKVLRVICLVLVIMEIWLSLMELLEKI